MKLLTVNFLTCAVKSCKSSLSTTTTTTTTTAGPLSSEPITTTEEHQQHPSPPPSQPQPAFPLHFRDAVLERTEIPLNPIFIRNILPRVHWDALRTTASELGLSEMLPERNPVDDYGWDHGGSGGDGGGGGGGGSGGEEKEGLSVSPGIQIEMEHDDPPRVADEEQSSRLPEEAKALRQLHTVLLETAVSEGKLVCGRCGFEYPIKEGVANFLLPAHLG